METVQDLQSKPYWLYLLECQDGSYYAGIAVDVQKRLAEHRQGKGAAYTASHPPLRVLASQVYPTRAEALKAEYALKQLPKARKLGFFASAADPLGLPLLRHKRVFHVGTFDPAAKGTTHNRQSLEGNGLSVSLHPEAWRGIARLGNADVWTLTAADGDIPMVDALSMQPQQWAAVSEWARQNGLLQKTKVLRVSWFDDELDGSCQMDFDLQQKGKTRGQIELAARLEAESREEASVEMVSSWQGTLVLNDRIGFEVPCMQAQDVALTLYVQDVLFARSGTAGVWWNEDLDPQVLSAPRGVIHLGALPGIRRDLGGPDDDEHEDERSAHERCRAC